MPLAMKAFEIGSISPTTPGYLRALHRALDVPCPGTGRPPAGPVADLLATLDRGTASIDMLLGAYSGGQLLSVCLAVESPGAVAMVFAPSGLRSDLERRALVAMLRRLQVAARERSLVLLEALVRPDSQPVARALSEAGFRYLTRLCYLRIDLPGRASCPPGPTDLEWVTYAPDREGLFREALELTYAQSLDCPELSGLRPSSDALAGHRATGIFDPQLWFVAKRGGQPLGLILLNRIVPEPALELVYMGVAQAVRRQGVANALLGRALDTAGSVGAEVMALAVDQRNRAARRLYARWGFFEMTTRDAWIACPCDGRV